MSDEQKTPPIDPEKFVDWLHRQSKLGEIRERQGGNKLLICSPFAEDLKFKCGIFPHRGDNGRYHDFKSGKQGDLYGFVMEIEDCGFGKALKLISSGGKAYRPSTKPKALAKNRKSIESLNCDLKWPKGLKRIKEDSDIPEIRAAAEYMKRRGLNPKEVWFYYCTKDHWVEKEPRPYLQKLKGRILMPFFGPGGNPIYWSARAMDKSEPKYYEPDPHDGPADKEAVMYCLNWEKIVGRRVLVCEGAVDALSVWMAGIPAVSTQGAQYYALQDMILKGLDVTPVFGFDRDTAGRRAVLEAQKVYGRDDAFFVFPPAKDDDPSDEKGHDWNSLLVSKGPEYLKQYILKTTRHLDEKAIFMIQRAAA